MGNRPFTARTKSCQFGASACGCFKKSAAWVRVHVFRHSLSTVGQVWKLALQQWLRVRCWKSHRMPKCFGITDLGLQAAKSRTEFHEFDDRHAVPLLHTFHLTFVPTQHRALFVHRVGNVHVGLWLKYCPV